MEKVNVVFTDDNNNFYGILTVVSGYDEKTIKLILKDIIISMFGNSKNFFENFSDNLSKVFEVFSKEIVEKFGSEAIIQFEYNNGSMFNVDKVFNITQEIVDTCDYNEQDIIDITDTICSMLENNCRLGISGMGESFVNWCENGNCFTDNKRIRTTLMKAVCFEVDKLSEKLLDLFNILDDREDFEQEIILLFLYYIFVLKNC